MGRFLSLIIITLMYSGSLFAQASWQDYFMDAVGLEDYNEVELQEFYEHLTELEAHPININAATYDDFSRIPGLFIEQISDIMYYRDKYGAFRTMEELALISSIDRPMRLMLSQIMVAEPLERAPWYTRPALDSLLKRGSHTLLASTSAPLFRETDDDNEYLGNMHRYTIKLRGKFSDNLNYGLTGAKDAGEPFLTHGNGLGFDQYSGFISAKNIRRITSLTLGRYRIRMGMGLTLNNGFSLGKQSMLTTLGSSSAGTSISGHASRSDGHYLQGAATTLNLSKKGSSSKLFATGFWSYRKMDATLNKDGTAATLLTTGYHRTENEIEKRNNTSEMMAGGHLEWQHNAWHFGVSGTYTWYDRPLDPGTQDYRRYYPRGNSFWNSAVNYGYISGRLSVMGETATGDCGSIATVNMLTTQLFGARITAIQRFYSYEYYATLASSFSDCGRVQNESGIYVGAQIPLSRRLKLDIYSDYAYFPWVRYQVDVSSSSWDNSATMTWNKRSLTLTGRYRLRIRSKETVSDEHSARLSATYDTGIISLRSQADYRIVSTTSALERGMMFSQMVTISPLSWLKTTLSGGYYDTTGYNSRVFIYEKGMLESFNMLTLYGKGMRLAALLRCDFSRRMMAMAKLGYTTRNKKTDIDIQFRIKL